MSVVFDQIIELIDNDDEPQWLRAHKVGINPHTITRIKKRKGSNVLTMEALANSYGYDLRLVKIET
tara:strand:+ start:349 stop:546 length:198 start_codon:yes stop_codon:yes gene_type:complete